MRKDYNILFLLHLPPPVHGSSIVGLSIKESISINNIFKCSFINLLSPDNIPEKGKISFKKILGFLIILSKVIVTLIKNRPQLCYLALTSTGVAFYKDFLIVALLKLFRVKRIFHLHNKGISLFQNKYINKLCYRSAFNGADVILLSMHLYSDVKIFVPVNKVHICPNGIPDNKISIPDGDQKNKNVVQILFLSNIIESKGVFVLLEACLLLKKKYIPFNCVFIGSEGNISALQLNEKINSMGLREQIKYLGEKFGEEKDKAFLKADIFSLPSYNECLPLVLLEAMRNSLPVVSTVEGGIPDLIEDNVNGFLVPQRDVVALAEKLEFLIKRPDIRLKMGTAGRIKYEKEFTFEKFENRLVEVLNNVVKKV